MQNENAAQDLNKDHSASDKYLPTDPSNTSDIGKSTDQGVVSKQEGITEQSSKLENDFDTTSHSLIDSKADHYIKNPSPEDNVNE